MFGSTLCIGDPRAQDMTFERYGIPRGAPGSEFGRACSTNFGGTGNRLHAGPMSVGNPGDAHLSGTVGLEGRARLFGGLRKDAWNGLPLPFALDAWGAPGCTLHSGLEWEWPAYWYDFPSAFKFFSLDLPNDPTVIGQRVYLQGVIPTRQNALGFETSNGCEVTVGPHIDPPLSVVHTPSANGGVEGGQRHVGHGPVLELRGR